MDRDARRRRGAPPARHRPHQPLGRLLRHPRRADEYLRQYPQQVRTIVLDGVAPPDMVLPAAFAIDADAALASLAAACKADEGCRARYPDFDARISALLGRADTGFDVDVRHPVTGASQPLHIDRRMQASLLRVPLYVPMLSAVLPHAIARAGAGDFEPLVTLSMAVSGPDHAYDRVVYIATQLPAGWFIRGLHHWGASAMVVVTVAHLLRVFFYGAYKYPREATWITGVFLLLIVIGFGFTGYLLPWDQKAFWATTVGTRIAGLAPGIGDWMLRIARGGPELSAVTLARFFGTHIWVLPASLATLVLVQLYLVIRIGITAVPSRKEE